MGGYGSGRRRGRSRKTTVEECLILSADKLARDRMLREGLRGPGALTWTRVATGEKVSSMGYGVDTLDRAAAWIRLHYARTQHGEDVDYRIHLTPLPWGGVRWRFVCPLTVNGRTCRRRCGKLYLPLGGRYFGCRLCYDLTYTSSQEAHKFDGLFRLLAAETGMSAATVKRPLKT